METFMTVRLCVAFVDAAHASTPGGFAAERDVPERNLPLTSAALPRCAFAELPREKLETDR